MMTRHVPMSEFKDHASEYVTAAENGEDIVITRHGKPAVVMKAATAKADRARAERVETALQRLAEMRAEMRAQGRTVTMDEVIEWKNEGRR